MPETSHKINLRLAQKASEHHDEHRENNRTQQEAYKEPET